MEELISKHLDIWTEAQVVKAKGGRGRGKKTNGQSYGIKKLRELILELAVRGKLVVQDANDEPASELLAKIANEKARLLKDKKIKKQKKLPEISEDEKPFELPKGWEWARLGNIGETNIGLTYSPPNVGDEGIPVLRAGNIQDRKIVYSDLIRVSVDATERVLVSEGDLLICARSGSRSLVGKAAIIPPLKEITAFGAFMAIFRSHINQYIHHFISSPVFRHAIDNVETTTINQITQGNLKSTVIPLPPLAEQHRIVAKVDELMALCDQLEQQQTASNTTLQTLRNTVLTSLTSATNPTGFSETWQRIANNFATLFNTEQAIDQLKQTILQLAVMGKLVPQNPKDEPASILLEKITQQKAILIKEGKIKKQKKLPEINVNAAPFELPLGWAWGRFPEIGEFGRGKSKHRPRNDPALYSDGKYPLIQTGDVARANGVVETYTALYNDTGLAQSRLWPKGTMCITIAANIADSSILGFDACFPDSVVGLIPFAEVGDIKYFEYFMRTAKAHLMDFAPSTAQKNINLGILETVYIPLPPKREIERIVAKVDELLNLCEQLKTKLTSQHTTTCFLADAFVQQSIHKEQ